MRNVLIELNNVTNKVAAAVVSLTDACDVAWTLKSSQYALKMKRNSIQSEHILDDVFRKTAERGPHNIAKQSYEDITVGRPEKDYNFCDSVFGIKAKLKLLHTGHMSVGLCMFRPVTKLLGTTTMLVHY